MTKQLFIALVPLGHSGEERSVPVGEVVSLDHLSQAEVEHLVALEAVAPVAGITIVTIQEEPDVADN